MIVKTNDQNYKDIANAIREKIGTDQVYKPSEMAGAIRDNTAPIESASKGLAIGTGIASVNRSLQGKLQDLKIYGKSSQFTTTGAQLLDKDSFFVDPPMTKDVVKYYPMQVPDGNYTLSADIPFTANIANLFLITGNVTSGAGSVSNGVYSGRPITAYSSNGYITIGLRTEHSSNPNNPLDYNIMLNSGSTALPWEPYTGDMASPNPEYPQEIVNTGDDGQVDLTVTRKNLFDVMRLSYQAPTGSRFKDLSVNDGVISFVATGVDVYLGTTLNRGLTAVENQFVMSFSARPNTAYTIGLSNSRLIKNFVTFLDKNNVSISGGMYFNKPVLTFVTPQDCVTVLFRIGNGNSVEGESYATTIMVNIGDTAQPWQPYTAQQLIVPTPDGLPGIPVDSGGNWTDENGQQWVSDVVDLVAGIYTKRCFEAKITQDSPIYESFAGGVLRFNLSADVCPPATSGGKGICNTLPVNNVPLGTDNALGISGYTTGGVYFRNPEWTSLDEVKAYLASTDIVFIYPLATPITTPLDSATISAYRALQSYPGTTNVLAPDAGIRLEAYAQEDKVSSDILDGSINGIFINNDITYIRPNAFLGLSNLISISVPEVTKIDASAFQNCTNLKYLILGKDQVCVLNNSNAFDGTLIKSGTGYIYVPDDLVDQYKQETNWSSFSSKIKPISELPGGLT